MADPHGSPQPRISFGRRGALAGALSLMALAGCTTVVPRGAPPPDRAPPPGRPQPTQPGQLPSDAQRHRVALLVPLSGGNAGVGQSIANAATMALLDTGGTKVRITTYDTALGAGAAAARALADGNRLILGPLLAEDVRAVAPAARAAGVPVIAFSNDASVAGNGTYLMGFSPAQSIERVVAYARSRGMTRFAGLVPGGIYGRTASAVLIRAVEQAGGSVAAMQTYERQPQAIAAAVARLGREPYDAVLIADGARVAIQAAPLVRRGGGAKAKLLGTELWETDPAMATSAALNGAWFASVSDTMYRQLSTKYRARYGKGPYRLASLGYDAVLLTVRIASEWRVGTPFPARELTESGGFAGVDGAFRFRRDGIAERALEVNEVGGGKVSTVSPAPRGF
ncbi:penicillin-binding protein activator [Sphingomonas jatrophae]|uniref:Amino acid/amide ABC transporter substrate-binding protein, HAAT family n=1 Tax=Sphingomonas jatrophae TaxID=1166337 RepID=A0A1I6JHI8_9SPHN|nr:penicillin-binding protein activator [Sphingomonas jatrophae]SFR78415.1 amino acid/amide ABC transporter substrate-binding protein, HAAT family [Sphingomonas jatrophae]